MFSINKNSNFQRGHSKMAGRTFSRGDGLGMKANQRSLCAHSCERTEDRIHDMECLFFWTSVCRWILRGPCQNRRSAALLTYRYKMMKKKT